MNLADLRTKISTIVLKIIELLSDNDWDIREASINALSKLAEHGKAGILYYTIC